MSRSPDSSGARLHKGLKQQVIAELTAAFQEVLHERRRNHSAHPSSPTGRRLRPPVHPAPALNESGES